MRKILEICRTHLNTPYAHLLRAELESFRRSADAYLYHEHLEEHNDPIYFYQFAERAQKHGLRYLAEADLRVMVPGNFPPEIENVIHRAMLAKELAELVRQGALTVEKDGQPVRAEQALAAILREAIDAQLATMARSALLEVTLRVG